MAVGFFSFFLTVVCVGLYGANTTKECSDPVVTPASLLVEYGDPAEVNCSIPLKPGTGYWLSWESKSSTTQTDSVHRGTGTEISFMWKVDSLTNWEEADNLKCTLETENSQPDECVSHVNLTIYKRPDSVMLSSLSHVWIAGDQTDLICQIENVGPGRKLSVHWSRADPKQNKAFTLFSETSLSDLVNEMRNVNVTVKLNVTARREDDGVQYKCAAVLNLDPVLVVSESQPITITVHSGQLPLSSVWGMVSLLAVVTTVL